MGDGGTRELRVVTYPRGRVLVDNWEAARALDECQERIVELYARCAKG